MSGGFKAAEAFAALEYDFNPFVEAAGTIAEPTQPAFLRFLERLEELQGAMRKLSAAANGADDLGGFMAGVDSAKTAESNAAMLDAVAELCDGSPSREQLEALPYRHQVGFVAYLVGGLVDPLPSSAATTPSPAALTSGPRTT